MEITTERRNTSLFESSTYNETITFMHEEYEEKKRILDFFKVARIIVPIIFALIIVTGIAGNTLTVTVILLNKDSKTITDILIINLAVADIFFIVFCIPFIAVEFAMLDAFGNSQWPFGDEWCRVVEYVTYACSYTSIYILILISLDRYLALVHPIRALILRTKSNCYKALIFIWSIVFLGNIPMIFETPYCAGVTNYMKQSSLQMLYICFFVFGFILPIILMCIPYVHMLKIYITGHIPGLNNHTSHFQLRSKQRVTKMVITVVMVCIICRLPFHIVSLYVLFANYFQNTPPVIQSIIIVTQCILYLNCCINPILYTFYSKTFRNVYKHLLSCKRGNDLENGTEVNLQ